MDSAVSYGEGEKRLGTPYSGRLDEIVNTKECRYSFPANQIQCKSSMNVTLPNRCSNLTNQVSNDSHRGGEEKSKNTDKTDTRKEATKGNQSYHVEVDSSDKVKTKLMSMWNNMKYGWTVKVKTNFSYESPIWLLGKCYHKKLQDEHSPESSDFATRNLSMELFKQDFSSRIWFTYRREFPSLAGSSLTTDCGWGCMLRSGQMLLAQAFICHFLYRDWQWTRSQTSRNELYHRTILRWFGDHPCVSSPFSVHQLVALGECAGKKAGDWYGPASVAHILKQSLQMASKEIPLLDTICVYVAQDCTIYQQDVYDLCSRAPQRHVSSENECHAGDCCDEVFTQSRNSSVEISTKYFKNEQLRQVQTDAAGSSVDNRTDSRYFTNWEDCNKIYNHQNNCTKPRKIAVDGSDFELQEFHCDFKANHFGDPCLYTDNIEKAVEYSYMPDCKNKLKEMSLSNFLLETESENSLCDKSENFATYVDNISYPFHSPKSISGSCDQNTEKYCDKTRRVSHYSLSRSSSVPSPPTEEASHFPEDSVDGNMQKDGHILVESHEHSNWRRGVIILVPVRLGGDVLNRAYIPRVRNLLTQEHCIGIIGGRPRHSLYFVGWQDDKFVYLDPHYCQETVDVCTSDFPLQSFHCSVPRKMLCTKMDPSCTIGFYCKRKSDFHEFMRATEQILSPFKEKGDYPIFTIQDGKREDAANAVDAITKEQQLAQSLNYSWIQDDELETIEIDGEDFVVI